MSSRTQTGNAALWVLVIVAIVGIGALTFAALGGLNVFKGSFFSAFGYNSATNSYQITVQVNDVYNNPVPNAEVDIAASGQTSTAFIGYTDTLGSVTEYVSSYASNYQITVLKTGYNTVQTTESGSYFATHVFTITLTPKGTNTLSVANPCQTSSPTAVDTFNCGVFSATGLNLNTLPFVDKLALVGALVIIVVGIAFSAGRKPVARASGQGVVKVQ